MNYQDKNKISSLLRDYKFYSKTYSSKGKEIVINKALELGLMDHLRDKFREIDKEREAEEVLD